MTPAGQLATIVAMPVRLTPSPALRLLAGLAVWLALIGMLQPAAAQPAAPGASLVDERRIALVIGNAAYKHNPLDNPVNDARLIARTLTQAGFAVTLKENLDRPGLFESMRQFGDQLNENTVAVLYYAGHGMQLRDRNFMIPVEAEFRREEDILVHGVDLSLVLERMSQAKSRVNVVILDACRDNPFPGRATATQGLAQMDAPIGTVLAFATAPGKKAPDNAGGGDNSVYSAHLARHLLTRGLPVELMFKRVREGVVRETGQLQVPWEHSSLQGEFAFVPGVNASAEAPSAAQVDVELAYWNSVQSSTRADEYRSYLRQYPTGRFAELARSRLAAMAAIVSAAAPPPTAASARAELMPRVGDTWRYRISDQFRLGDLFVTARVDAVGADGVAETWTTTSDAKVRTTLVPPKAGFSALPGWDSAPPEFAPYLLQDADAPAGSLPTLGRYSRRIDSVAVPLQAQWLGEEEVVVAAGRFRALKLRLRGESSAQRGSNQKLSAEHTVWYAPGVKRIVRYEVRSHAGRTLRESTTFELTEYRLN